MSEPHIIRLREPWESELASGGPAMRTRWRRRFGRPTGLVPGVRLTLVIEARQALVELRLNDRPLGGAIAAGETFAVEITGAVEARNELTLWQEGSAANEIPFSAWLEIAEV